MRFAAFLCASALWVVAGCATTHPVARLTSEQQWEALCRRMPQRRQPVGTLDIRRSSPSREEETTLQRVASAAMDSVVRVRTAGPNPGGRRTASTRARVASSGSGGTGVVISSDGLILTNEHVVRYADSVTVVLRDGSEYSVKAIVVHPRMDVAVLRIGRTLLSRTVPSLEPVASGMPVVAVSYATEQREQWYRTGVVTSGRRSLQRELDPAGRRDYGDLVETTAKLEPGFSGGPLFNLRGQLVGLNVAVSGSPETDRYRGYAIPFDRQMDEAVRDLVALAKSTVPAPP